MEANHYNIQDTRSIIIVSLLFISVPLIVNSYQSYKRAEQALIEISVLRNVAELTNNISRERAPANQVMSSTPEKRAEYIQELKRYRANVDQQIEETAQLLKRNGFIPHAYHLSHQLQASLKEGRDAVMLMLQLLSLLAVQLNWIMLFRKCLLLGIVLSMY